MGQPLPRQPPQDRGGIRALRAGGWDVVAVARYRAPVRIDEIGNPCRTDTNRVIYVARLEWPGGMPGGVG